MANKSKTVTLTFRRIYQRNLTSERALTRILAVLITVRVEAWRHFIYINTVHPVRYGLSLFLLILAEKYTTKLYDVARRR